MQLTTAYHGSDLLFCSLNRNFIGRSKPCSLPACLQSERKRRLLPLPLLSSLADDKNPPPTGGEQQQGTGTGVRSYVGEGPRATRGWTGETAKMLVEAMRRWDWLSGWLEDELQDVEASMGYDIPGGRQIVEYDPHFLSKLGWLINLRGSIFNIRFIHLQFFLLLLLAVFYAFSADHYSVMADFASELSSSSSSSSCRWQLLSLPIITPQTAALSFVSGVLGFFLSLFNSLGLALWWKVREARREEEERAGGEGGGEERGREEKRRGGCERGRKVGWRKG
eukprot:762905-Hanusia_phi.AAC.5